MSASGRWAVVFCLLLVIPAWSYAGQKDKTGKKTEQTASAASVDTDTGHDETDVDAEGGKSGSEQVDEGAYKVRLRDLEDRVNRLKEQIFRSKARLNLLAETVLDRKIAGARASLVFKNKMGSAFRLERATILLDGGPVFNKTDEGGSLAEREEIELFDGPVMPGDHTLSVVLHYRGHGFGVFSYLKGYTFKTRSSYTFSVGEGKASHIEIIGFEKGGATVPLEERPSVSYIEKISDYNPETGESDK